MLRAMNSNELGRVVHLTIQYCPGESNHAGMYQIVAHLRRCHWDLPYLNTLAVQTPQPLRKFRRDRRGETAFEPEEWWRLWFLEALDDIFEKRATPVDVVLEAWVVLRSANPRNGLEAGDEMVRVRGTWCRTVVDAAGEVLCVVHKTQDMEYEVERRGVRKACERWKMVYSHRYRVGPEWMEFWYMYGMGYHC
jgi:hypothetical protein